MQSSIRECFGIRTWETRLATLTSEACSRCPCGGFVGGSSARFCADCGHSRSDHELRVCPSCGARLAEVSRHCTSCGAPLLAGARASRPSTPVEQAAAQTGAAIGYATRTAVAVAAEPVASTVWKERPNIPTWQKVVGVIAWPLMVLTPHGLVFLGASFLVMVVLGRHNPYSWFAWVTRWSTRFLAVTVVIAVVVLAIYLGSRSPSNATGTILLLRML